MRVGALLNRSSGSCDVEAEKDLTAILNEAGIEPVSVWCGGGEDLEDALSEASRDKIDLLIVLGGDGTIRAAAETCAAGGVYLVPLPGGTMNMLPKALYGNRAWREALRDTLAAPETQAVHGGQVGDHRFFVAGIFGGPTLLAEAREAMREGDIAGALEKGVTAIRQALNTELEYRFADRAPGRAEAVAVLCPLTSNELDNDEEVLEAAAIDIAGGADALRLALTAAFRDWRQDPTVDRAKVVRLDLVGQEPIPALLDGERFTLSTKAEITLAPRAFQALKPRET